MAKDGTYKGAFFYQEFLAGVKSEKQASISNLDRRVLAVQSGGDVLDPHKDLATSFAYDGRSGKMTMGTSAGRGTELAMQIVDFDLAGEINRCVEEADAFYALSFNPAYTEVADEYHELKVLVDKPGFSLHEDWLLRSAILLRSAESSPKTRHDRGVTAHAGRSQRRARRGHCPRKFRSATDRATQRRRGRSLQDRFKRHKEPGGIGRARGCLALSRSTCRGRCCQ